MSVYRKNLGRSIAVCALLLAACGGGGGGGGGGPAVGSGGSLTLAPTSLSFVADQNGAVPASKNIIATFNEATVAFFVVGIPAGQPVPPWLNFSYSGNASPITVTIGPNTTAMAPGTYSATVRIVTAAADQSVISLRDAPVTYTLNGIIAASPTSLNFDEQIGVSTPAAQNVTVSDTANSSYAWTASTSYQSGSGWLLLNGAPAANGQTVTQPTLAASVSGAALQPGTYKATIQISGNGRTANVAVTYVRRAPRVTFVAPYVGLTNTAGQVIIRGSGFNAISTQKVKFGATDAMSQTVNSDTQITASYPALAAGTYPVFVENSTGTQFTRASLVIVDAPAFADEAVTRSGVALDLIHDPERQAIYVANVNGSIDRYRYLTGTWNNADSLAVPDLRGFALTPDGKEIIAINKQQVLHIDPVTLTLSDTVDGPVPAGERTFFELEHIAIANNGVAVIASVSPTTSGAGDPIYAYDVLSKTSSQLPFDFFGLSDGVVAAAGDGSRVIAVGQAGSPPAGTHYYDALTASFNLARPGGIALLLNGSFTLVNKDASKFLHGFTSVYSGAFSLLGDLPGVDPGGSSFNLPAFSPVGDFIYTYSVHSQAIRKFDLASPDGSGGFTQVGGSTAPFSTPLNTQAIRVSFDGGKLFMADDAKLVVQAAP